MTALLQPIPDSALIERMMAGDEQALAALYDRYSGMLFGMLMRILKDAQTAEEVLQDLFLQLWREAGRFDATPGVSAGLAAGNCAEPRDFAVAGTGPARDGGRSGRVPAGERALAGQSGG